MSSVDLDGEKKLCCPVVIISDTHLGKKYCQADMLLEFLMTVECKKLILDGDIVDGWALTSKKQKPFPEMHRRVIDAIQAKIEGGTKVIYIPGNHDVTLRGSAVIGKTFHGIFFEEALSYEDQKGRKALVLHGDQYDGLFLNGKGKILAHVGDHIYDGLIAVSIKTGKWAHKLLKKRFSLAAYLKHETKKFIQLINDFEKAVIESAQKNDVDGIICGHIHTAELREIDVPQDDGSYRKIFYGNSGDWVESCTALTKNAEGQWNVLRWLDIREEFGFTDPPKEIDQNPFAQYRSETNRLLLWVNRLWGGKDRAKKMEAILEAKKELSGLSTKNKKPDKQAKLENQITQLRAALWPKYERSELV